MCGIFNQKRLAQLRLFLVLKIAYILMICLNLLSAVDALNCLVLSFIVIYTDSRIFFL